MRYSILGRCDISCCYVAISQGATNIGELPLAADTTISKDFGGGDGIIYNTIAIDDTLSIELLSGAMSNPIVVGIVDIPMTGACLSN